MHNYLEVTYLLSILRARHLQLIPHIKVLVPMLLDIICPVIEYCIFWSIIPINPLVSPF